MDNAGGSSLEATNQPSAGGGSMTAHTSTHTGGGLRLLVVVGVALLDDNPLRSHPQQARHQQHASTQHHHQQQMAQQQGQKQDGQLQQQGQQQEQEQDADRPVRVLLAQRPPGKANAGLWEFPGGKVDAGETPEAALVRELYEELGISVEPTDLVPLTFASHTYPAFHLLMPLYVCRCWRGEPRGLEGQAVAWATVSEVASFPLTPADVPLVPAVLRAMGGRGA